MIYLLYLINYIPNSHCRSLAIGTTYNFHAYARGIVMGNGLYRYLLRTRMLTTMDVPLRCRFDVLSLYAQAMSSQPSLQCTLTGDRISTFA